MGEQQASGGLGADYTGQPTIARGAFTLEELEESFVKRSEMHVAPPVTSEKQGVIVNLDSIVAQMFATARGLQT